MSSTGTTTCRSSSLRTPASTSRISRPEPATNRPISSSGRCVADRPTRWNGDSTRRSSRSSESARCAPRLEPATACTSSRITVSIPRSVSRACDVRSRKSDSGVVMRMSGGVRSIRRRSSGGRVAGAHRHPELRVETGERAAEVPLDVVVERLERRDVEQPEPLPGRLVQPVDAEEERRERLPGSGRGLDEDVPAVGDRRPSERLRRRRRPRTHARTTSSSEARERRASSRAERTAAVVFSARALRRRRRGRRNGRMRPRVTTQRGRGTTRLPGRGWARLRAARRRSMAVGAPRRTRALAGTHSWGSGGEDDRTLGGRVIGGSSAVNACMVVVGAPRDYDEWGEGWTHDELDPYLRARRRDAAHGAREHRDPFTAPCGVSRGGAGDSGSRGSKTRTIRRTPVGVAPFPANVVGGRRWSTALAYLDQRPEPAEPLRRIGEARRQGGDRTCAGDRGRCTDGSRVDANTVILAAGALLHAGHPSAERRSAPTRSCVAIGYPSFDRCPSASSCSTTAERTSRGSIDRDRQASSREARARPRPLRGTLRREGCEFGVRPGKLGSPSAPVDLSGRGRPISVQRRSCST